MKIQIQRKGLPVSGIAKACLRLSFVAGLLLTSIPAQAATIILHNLDAGSGSGFDDPTPVSPVPGNSATTLGGQRLAAFQAAANEWAQTIASPVPIEIDIEMSNLFCTSTYAVLGSAGPNGIIFRDFPNAPAPGTWYGQALANSIRLFDGNPGTSDIVAEFNQNIGQPNCLAGASWSYVIGSPPPPGTLAFTETVIHEIAHGLGFTTYTNLGTGSQYAGYPDGFSRFLYDENIGARWPSLSNAQRLASAKSGGQLTWDGPAVTSAAGILSQGRHPSGRVRMYAPDPIESGSSVVHFSDTLNPADIMTPSLQPGAMRTLAIRLLEDYGWNVSPPPAHGISVSTISGDTTEAGGTATFSVVLWSQPTSNVTIGLSSSDTSEGTVSTSSITFTSGNWDSPQFVTVTGVDDAVADGDITYFITTNPASSGDSNYNGINPADVSVTNLDDEVAGGVTVSGISGDTTESGGTATFSIVLDAQPTSGVSIGVSSNDLSEGTVSPSSVSFSTGNWSTPKFVTVTGVDDAIIDGDVTFSVVTSPASSSDPNYNGFNPDDVSVTNLDNDSAGISVSSISGNTTESGGSATFSIVLNTQPTSGVSIGLSSSDLSEGTVSPSSVSFTTGNWDTPKVVTVTGVDDVIVDGNVNYTIVTAPASSGDSNYHGINPGDVSVTNLDNDNMGITVSSISGDTTESGNQATFSIVLNSQPTSSVTVGVTSTDLSEGTLSHSSVSFSTGNWGTPKLVTVTGVDDDVVDGPVTYTVATNPATSSDPNYNGINPNDVSVTNLDNDSTGVSVSTISGTTTEAGGSATFTMVLQSQPTSGVSFGVSSDDPTEGTVSPSTVSFTTGNWDTPKVVTVTGVDDGIVDGAVAYNVITAPGSSSDPNYNGMNPNDVSVTNLDDDAPGVTVSQISGDTTEGGGTATFTMVLNSQPSSGVSIGVAVSDPSEGSVSPSTVSFSTSNWDTPKVVTVTGLDDDIIDGDITFNVSTAPASSSDPNYNGLNPANVSVTNLDDDVAGITVSPISGDTTEAGATATFSVVLDTKPITNVFISMFSGDTTEGTVSTSSIAFTTNNWDTPQVLTVTGKDDELVDGDIDFSIVTNPATSSDSNYSGLNPDDVSVTNLDDDSMGITVSSISGDTTEAGVTATFSIVLDSQPSNSVSIGVSSNDLTEGTVSSSSVSFSPGNWDTPKFVTVTGADDEVQDGDIDFTIITAPASSSDPNYNGVNPNDVSVTNLDDDELGVTVSGISGNTTEAGGTATFTISLESQPLDTVRFAISSNDMTEGTVSPSEVTFTPGNWSSPRLVTVTGVDDDMDDGNVSFTIITGAATRSDSYVGINPPDVEVTNVDDDTLGISVSGVEGDTTEAGGATTFTIVLDSEPSDFVTIDLESDDLTEGTVSPASVTFMPQEWFMPVVVTVTGQDDALEDGDVMYWILTAPAISGDFGYDGLDAGDVPVVNLDDDSIGISVSPISGDTSESGAQATFEIVLDAQPLDNVTIDLISNDTSEGTVSPASVTFTSGNWDAPRTITVTGVDDEETDGDIVFTITTSPASSNDGSYNNLDPADVTVVNRDNEVPDMLFKAGFE